MAPSFIIGYPQRSLVRIPGSGTDKVKKPVCLEVAQITNFKDSGVIPEHQLPPPEVPFIGNRRNCYNIFEASNAVNDSENATRKRPLEGNDIESRNKTSKSDVEDDTDPKLLEMRSLLMKRRFLINENDELQTKVRKFKEILKDPIKLKEFLVIMKDLKC